MKQFKLIGKLLLVVKKFSLIIFLAVINGVMGNAFAISISTLAAIDLVLLIKGEINFVFYSIIIIMISLGVLRGLLRYFEQYSNHIIAFKILAHVRHIIFEKLAGREQEIILKRYGLCGNLPMTQNEIADELKISRSYISRLEKKALLTIKNNLKI